MSTHFEIKGDLVYKITKEVNANSDGSEAIREQKSAPVKVEDWMDTLWKQVVGTKVTIPALPTGCGRIAGLMEKGDKTVVAVELSPCVKNLRGKFNSNDGEERYYKISFPFIIILIRFHKEEFEKMVYIYYRNQPLLLGEDMLFHSNLPNVDENDQICWGGSSISSDCPLWKRVAQIWKRFWESSFNMDLYSDNFEPSSELEGHPKNFEEWEKMTKKSPEFIFKINWRETGKTLDQKLEEVLNA